MGQIGPLDRYVPLSVGHLLETSYSPRSLYCTRSVSTGCVVREEARPVGSALEITPLEITITGQHRPLKIKFTEGGLEHAPYRSNGEVREVRQGARGPQVSDLALPHRPQV